MDIIELLRKSFNATDEQITAFSAAMKEAGIYTTAHENMDVRYPKMKNELEGTVKERDTALGTIAELQKAAKGNADLQKIVETNNATIEQLRAQLEETQIDADMHVALLAEGVKPDDIDYVMYKLKAKGKLERGEDGKIKDMDDKIAALKTQLPSQFAGDKKKNILENKLPENGGGDRTVTQAEFDKMGYNAKVELKQQNPELYSKLTKG